MNREYNIDKIVSEIDFSANEFRNVNGFNLTNREIEVLDRYKINYKKCNCLKEILFDYISATISERDYYQNTNK